jgi:hypothetical protein
MKKIIVILVILSVGFWFWSNKKAETKKPNQQIQTEQKVTEEKCGNANYVKCKDYPQFDLPLKYFSNQDVKWGSLGGDGKKGTIEEYDQAALDSKEIYQSYPTTTTTIKNYSSEIIPLTTEKFSDVFKKIQETEGDSWLSAIKKNYQDYGQMAVHFLKSYIDIEMYDTFDVDNDGVKEKILGLNSIGRASGGSYNAAIIKGNNIIFSVDEDNSFIVPHETGNGFYVEWRNPTDESSRCCQTGYIRTRFVYEGGKFVPIYEQEIRYFMVGKQTDY